MKKRMGLAMSLAFAVMLAGCSGERAVEETVEPDVVTTIEVKMADENDLESAIKSAVDSKNMTIKTYVDDNVVSVSGVNYADDMTVTFVESGDATTTLYIRSGGEVCADKAIRVPEESMTEDDVNAAILQLASVPEDDAEGFAIKTALEESLGEKITAKTNISGFEPDIANEIKSRVCDWYFAQKAAKSADLNYEDGVLHEIKKYTIPSDFIKKAMEVSPFLFDSKDVTVVNQEMTTIDGAEYTVAQIKCASHGEDVDALFYINGDKTEKIAITYSNGQRIEAYPEKLESTEIPAYFDDLDATDISAGLEEATDALPSPFDVSLFYDFLNSK